LFEIRNLWVVFATLEVLLVMQIGLENIIAFCYWFCKPSFVMEMKNVALPRLLSLHNRACDVQLQLKQN